MANQSHSSAALTIKNDKTSIYHPVCGLRRDNGRIIAWMPVIANRGVDGYIRGNTTLSELPKA